MDKIMLYQLHDFHRVAMTPLAGLHSATAQFLSSPFNPLAYSPLYRPIAAASDVAFRLIKEYEKPEWDLDQTIVDGKSVPVSVEVASSRPFCNLLHFKRKLSPRRRRDPSILLVAPMSGHHATLLRDTVKSLIQNHEVYVTDWVDARVVPREKGAFSLADYVHYVQGFIRELGPGLHVMAVCQPTVPVLAAVSLMAQSQDSATPKSMILMGGPIDTRVSPTEVNQLAADKPYAWFESMMIHRVPPRHPGAGREVYPGFLQHTAFVSMNPNRHFRSHYDYFIDLLGRDEHDIDRHRAFYDEYNAVLDIPAEFYLDTIKVVFQEHSLARGEWVIEGIRVDPSAIKQTALFTIEGELDDITGLGQTEAAHSLCSSLSEGQRKHYVAPGSGHYGIFSGSRWRENIYPMVSEFVRGS